MTISVEKKIQQHKIMAETICAALRKEVLDIGLPVNRIDPDISRVEFSLSKDCATSEDSLIGIWRDPKGNKQGEILFNADGSFYAEYDVISEHPKKPQWFVEAVIAWGRDNMVKAEAKLLPYAE